MQFTIVLFELYYFFFFFFNINTIVLSGKITPPPVFDSFIL